MPITLRLRTGEPVREPPFTEWQFVKADGGQIRLGFNGRQAALQANEWATFVGVVRQRHPAMWRSTKVIPELGGNDSAREILRGCEDTISYQLLLAGVDIVHGFRILEDGPVQVLLEEFANRNHTIRSVFGPGGIYLVPTMLFHNAAAASIGELVRENKLGHAVLIAEAGGINDDLARYYIPYAVPSTLEQAMSPEANQLWNVIRTEYYTFRHPLPRVPE